MQRDAIRLNFGELGEVGAVMDKRISMLVILGLVALGLIPALPMEAQAAMGGLLKRCVGPSAVDPTLAGKARRGDEITCSIAVENVTPSEGKLCIISTLDLFRGDPVSCTDQGCQCVGGSNDALACSGIPGDCPPPAGLDPGNCALLGRATGIDDNLLDAANNQAGTDWRQCVASDGSAGATCTGPADCAVDETCCVLLDLGFPSVSVDHLDEVKLTDPNPLTDNAVAYGLDINSGLPFTLQFQAQVNILTCEETSPDWDPACGGDCPPGDICVVVGPTGEETCACVTPCVDTDAPMCEGFCPPPQICSPDSGGGCNCVTPCADTDAPMCEGFCPPPQICSPDGGGGCNCVTPCVDADAPMCEGTCPPPQICSPDGGGGCNCVTPCVDADAPMCEGTCPPPQICSPGGGDGCVCLTPCEIADAPMCEGYCPPGLTCEPDDDSGCACEPPDDHFKCYKTRQVDRFPQQTVDLDDQFVTTTATVRRPHRFCNPVDKNNEGIDDPTAHLMCYDIKEPKFQKRNVVVENQFGPQVLTVRRPETLCVPAEKDDVPSALKINHFKCYSVTQARGTPKFTPLEVELEDQFETKTTIVVQPRTLCTPVDKNGEGILDPKGHIMCYRIKDAPGQPSFERRQVVIADQFTRTQPLNTVRGDCRASSFLCVPSTKRLVGETTTTTQLPATTTTVVETTTTTSQGSTTTTTTMIP